MDWKQRKALNEKSINNIDNKKFIKISSILTGNPIYNSIDVNKEFFSDQRSIINEEIFFTTEQLKSINDMSKGNTWFSAPTGYGKTTMALELIARSAYNKNETGLKYVFVVPSKSLVNELYTKMLKITMKHKWFPIPFRAMDMVSENSYKFNSIFIGTQEGFEESTYQYSDVEIAIFDEFQNASSSKTDSRVISLLSLVNKMKKASSRNVFMAPDAYGDQKSDSLRLFFKDLGCRQINSGERYSLIEDKVFKSKGLVEDIKGILKSGGKKIIYVNSINNITQILRTIDRNKPLTISDHLNDELTSDYEYIYGKFQLKGVNEWEIFKLIRHGIIPLFAGMPLKLRKHLVKLFDKYDEMHTLIVTPSFMQGVNTPADKVYIISDRKGISKISDYDALNIRGRVSRVGKGKFKGKCYAIDSVRDKYLENDEPISNPKIDIARYNIGNSEISMNEIILTDDKYLSNIQIENKKKYLDIPGILEISKYFHPETFEKIRDFFLKDDGEQLLINVIEVIKGKSLLSEKVDEIIKLCGLIDFYILWGFKDSTKRKPDGLKDTNNDFMSFNRFNDYGYSTNFAHVSKRDIHHYYTRCIGQKAEDNMSRGARLIGKDDIEFVSTNLMLYIQAFKRKKDNLDLDDIENGMVNIINVLTNGEYKDDLPSLSFHLTSILFKSYEHISFKVRRTLKKMSVILESILEIDNINKIYFELKDSIDEMLKGITKSDWKSEILTELVDDKVDDNNVKELAELNKEALSWLYELY